MMFERLRESVTFWWRNLGAIALVTIPFSLLSSALVLFAGAPLVRTEAGDLQLNGLTLALVFVIRTLSEAALIAQLAAIAAGRPRGLAECALFALTIAPAMLLCNVLVLTGTSLGLLAFILPGIWIYIRLSMASFAIALESAAPLDALQRSFSRTTGVQWELMSGWLLLLTALLLIISVIGGVLGGITGNHAGAAVVLDLLTAVGAALLHVLVFRYYGLVKQPDQTNL
jgi:hypothetical protein